MEQNFYTFFCLPYPCTEFSLVGGLIFDIHCKHNLDSYFKKKQFLEAEVDGGHREERLSVFEVEEGSRDER